MEQKKTFEPFEKILVRINDSFLDKTQKWTCCEFSHYDDNYICLVGGICHCISSVDILPFAGNEKIVGTSDMPEEEVGLKEGEYIVMFDELHELTDEPIIICKFKNIDIGCAQVLQFRSKKSFMRKYCIPFSKFTPNDMDEARKHILCVKDGKLVRARV